MAKTKAARRKAAAGKNGQPAKRKKAKRTIDVPTMFPELEKDRIKPIERLITSIRKAELEVKAATKDLAEQQAKLTKLLDKHKLKAYRIPGTQFEGFIPQASEPAARVRTVKD